MGRHIFSLALLLFIPFLLNGQQQGASIIGVVNSSNGPLIGATVEIFPQGKGGITDKKGAYDIESLVPGECVMKVSYIGHQSFLDTIVIIPGQNLIPDIYLREDILGLETAVVTASRSETAKDQLPVLVSNIDNRLFSATQAVSLAEGLSFAPGLRVENNCQNCGFTQLRMNGLEGPYTQILINSRPILSSLTGVYGLEMIPANMIDRVEVIRGGGSVMYGGNAIAGTVNIITKDPLFHSFEFGSNIALIDGNSPDFTMTANTALVSNDLKKGVTLYGFRRNRSEWDANNDEFSEMTRLRNSSAGLDAFLYTNELNKIRLNLLVMDEYRRGGNDFDLQPFQADIAEQVEHQVFSGNLSYEHVSRDEDNRTSVYFSWQHTDRQSYYGSGGRILNPGTNLTVQDFTALNAFGESDGLAIATGIQHAFSFFHNTLSLITGSEYTYNSVRDDMPGYTRKIDQTVTALGTYAQLEWSPNPHWKILSGARLDILRVKGLYTLELETLRDNQAFRIAVPRLSVIHHASDNTKIRFTYAQGYRAPQAFDEDLHIEIVGGAPLITKLSEGLVVERSHSYSLSVDHNLKIGATQGSVILEGFLTHLKNPFILSDQSQLPSGVALITRRNGDGARVAGINIEANLALSRSFVAQFGGTVQQASYLTNEVIWSSAVPSLHIDSVTSTRRLLRTPPLYGYFTSTWTPSKYWTFSMSGIYTGRMDVPHVINPETEYTIIKKSPDFMEMSLKISYSKPLYSEVQIQLSAGIQNLFNAYQNDLDSGPDRDAGYFYGPMRPRTIFVGVKVQGN